MAIIGITYDNQGPTAADDAVFYNRLMRDGIIQGCGISYVGTRITIQPGFLISAGRLCAIASAETIEVPAQLGVARAVLQTDLSKESSIDTFAQISIVVQTASTVDGLPSLIQEDINSGGIVYQQMLCVVDVTSSGILSVLQTAPRAGIAVPQVAVADATAMNVGPAIALDGEGPVTLRLPGLIRAELNAERIIAADGLCGTVLPENPTENQIFFLIEEAASGDSDA